MKESLQIRKIGKLRIYLRTGEAIKSKSLLRKMFPKTKYLKIIEEAKTSGIMNAHVFHTHAAVQRGGKISYQLMEGGNEGLTVCIELVDEKEKLEAFFTTHKDILKNNTVIYKEVEIWEYK